MKASNLLLSVFVLSAFIGRAQSNFHLTQYMVHQPFINPSAMASYDEMNLALFYRNQWTGFQGAPVTQGVSFSTPIGKTNNFLGLNVMHDVIGVNSSTLISLPYSYSIRLTKQYKLSFGIAPSISTIQSNLSEIHTINDNDPIYQQNLPTVIVPNSSFGMYFFSKRFYAGYAIPKMLHNNIVVQEKIDVKNTFNWKQLHHYLSIGIRFPVNRNLDFNVSTLGKYVHGSSLQLDINAQALFMKKVGIGASYRTSNELAAILTIQALKYFKFSYAYEYNFARIGDYSNGSHEIMLIIEIRKRLTPKVSVPRF